MSPHHPPVEKDAHTLNRAGKRTWRSERVVCVAGGLGVLDCGRRDDLWTVVRVALTAAGVLERARCGCRVGSVRRRSSEQEQCVVDGLLLAPRCHGSRSVMLRRVVRCSCGRLSPLRAASCPALRRGPAELRRVSPPGQLVDRRGCRRVSPSGQLVDRRGAGRSVVAGGE